MTIAFSFHLLLYVAALIAFLLATCNAPLPRVNLIGAGLLCWLLGTLIAA